MKSITTNYTEAVKLHLKACENLGITGTSVAKAFGYSRSYLSILLKNEGSLFFDLLDAERKRRCERLLNINPQVTYELIARKCGYRQPSSACQAFKRWYGNDLRQIRREHSALCVGVE